MNTNKHIWPWHLLTLVILFVMCAGLWVATKKIDYTWRWNRVPQYFLYNDETLVAIPFDGVVASLSDLGDQTQVKVVSEQDEEKTYQVDTKTLKVSQGEDLFEGDYLGSTFEWRAGPLLMGLWTTLWISAVASIFGMIIGLVTGLCRVSNNPTLRGLSVTYIE